MSGTEAAPGTTTEDGIETAEETLEAGDLTPPAANTWWQFADQAAAEEWANNLVTKRLSRVQKTKIDPLQQSHATLEAEVARLKPFEDAAMTDAEKRDAREAQKDQQIQELLDWKTGREHTDLIAGMADEAGLDKKFLKYLTAKDAEGIQAQIEDLLNDLSEVGQNAGKRTPKAKAPKADDADAGAGKGRGNGGGGNGDDSDEALIASILEETAKTRGNGGIRFS
ncbi:scaffolding protein [Mycobacterium phage Estes]|uniref:Scaffolding protein n=1 Tax=Mycobacterium phage Estes TaxID=2759459 RepID=A0A7G9A292_9CAUD|nr:head scaffolding protein [Mycobacterium phage Estes]QNL30731.1 scaffolding protein [Mycobacterium phage Estes]